MISLKMDINNGLVKKESYILALNFKYIKIFFSLKSEIDKVFIILIVIGRTPLRDYFKKRRKEQYSLPEG